MKQTRQRPWIGRSAGILALIVAIGAGANDVEREPPQYGGDLSIGTVYVTLSALSWDPVDWTWKSNHDTGLVREQLFAGDLDRGVRGGGDYTFVAEAYLPTDVIRGELAESWEWQDDLKLVVRLRQGVMFHDKPGVMASRELTAHDVKFTFDLVDASPKKAQQDYWDYIDELEVRDDHTLVFHFNEFNAEWAYRFGYGYQSSITARELADVDAKDWRNLMGTGPFELTKYIHGNSHTYRRRADYWDSEVYDGESYQLPYVDSVKYRIIKDEATYLTALRTAKVDILESIRWIAVDHLKESTPELNWSRWLGMSGNFIALRLDHPPFADPRVRRALNLAVNQREIVDLFYGGHAELMAYPQHPGFGAYYQPLEEMPASVQELFDYNPERAKELLAEAGYPDGFAFDVQVCSCSPSNMDLLPLIESYLAAIGVEIRIQPMEYASFLSAMTTQTHGPGYFMNNGHTNPTTTLRKFITGHKWNPALISRPEYDAEIKRLMRMPDEADRIALARELTTDLLDFAPYIWLPTEYVYTAWWPWVKNYAGELRAGAVRPGPIYARIWIDQALKRELGFLSALLEVRDLSVRFRTDRGTVQAVNAVDFDVDAGETLAIVGESGSGKSVTALSILQLIGDNGRIEAGSIRFDGVDLLGLSGDAVRAIRGDRIAMIFQEPMSSLNPVLTVGKQVAEPIQLHRGKTWDEAYAMAAELLARVAIPDAANRLDDYPHHFSGGMRQRVMIAMALACAPRLIIADEPTTALDVTVQAQILALLKELTREADAALILITHDLGVVARYADRVAVMYGGRIVETASARELYGNPRHPYTEGLMASIPGLDGVAGSRLPTIEGQPPDLANLPEGCAFAMRCPHARDECLNRRPELLDVATDHQRACHGYG